MKPYMLQSIKLIIERSHYENVYIYIYMWYNMSFRAWIIPFFVVFFSVCLYPFNLCF